MTITNLTQQAAAAAKLAAALDALDASMGGTRAADKAAASLSVWGPPRIRTRPV